MTDADLVVIFAVAFPLYIFTITTDYPWPVPGLYATAWLSCATTLAWRTIKPLRRS